MSEIRFGTDGWRGRMGREFSFRNVRRFATAYARFLTRRLRIREPRVFINHDTRILSRRFAMETARIFSLLGVVSMVPPRDVPLAAASLAIVDKEMDGGVAFTASFNPPVFNGIKVFNARGGPALPSTTALIEQEINCLPEDWDPPRQYADNSRIREIQPKESYLKMVAAQIDFDVIRKARFKIVVDNLFGASREFLDELFLSNGVAVDCIHSYPYAAHGQVIPYCSGKTLKDLSRMVQETRAQVGLATDIDGDRFGIIDSRGRFVDANHVIPLLIDYLVKVRGMRGGVVKSISSTRNIAHVAQYHGCKVYHTPVGFKYISDMMGKRDAFIGVESTNGAALRGRAIIKDGILFNLLIVEMMAREGKDLGQLAGDFNRRFPVLFAHEISLGATAARKERLLELEENPDGVDPGFSPGKLQLDDGVKWIGPDEWLLIRPSGTRKVMRIYAESTSRRKTRELIRQGRRILG
ncbi:MAG: hypothetical protein JXA62_05555 [Candidatus Aminicenantes bacterium]|nr:hypothetical protein [Candidatus Aminicenantes bacterium]